MNSFMVLNRLSARTAIADGSLCNAGRTVKSAGLNLIVLCRHRKRHARCRRQDGVAVGRLVESPSPSRWRPRRPGGFRPRKSCRSIAPSCLPSWRIITSSGEPALLQHSSRTVLTDRVSAANSRMRDEHAECTSNNADTLHVHYSYVSLRSLHRARTSRALVFRKPECASRELLTARGANRFLIDVQT